MKWHYKTKTDMIIEIKKDASRSDIVSALRRIRDHMRKKRKDPFKYYGKMKLDFDPLEWQKKIRNEWN